MASHLCFLLLFLGLYKQDYLQIFKMCLFLKTHILRLLKRFGSRKPVNHTSLVIVVTPTDRPQSIRNRCDIEIFGGVFCVVMLLCVFSCELRGVCHRTESDLFLIHPTDT